ncbi:MAG: hypothetical protein KA974_09990 [Saprospiraceae bacterium]|nr:hypothetical protein [Saprospiraceae bacterium]
MQQQSQAKQATTLLLTVATSSGAHTIALPIMADSILAANVNDVLGKEKYYIALAESNIKSQFGLSESDAIYSGLVKSEIKLLTPNRIKDTCIAFLCPPEYWANPAQSPFALIVDEIPLGSKANDTESLLSNVTLYGIYNHLSSIIQTFNDTYLNYDYNELKDAHNAGNLIANTTWLSPSGVTYTFDTTKDFIPLFTPNAGERFLKQFTVAEVEAVQLLQRTIGTLQQKEIARFEKDGVVERIESIESFNFELLRQTLAVLFRKQGEDLNYTNDDALIAFVAQRREDFLHVPYSVAASVGFFLRGFTVISAYQLYLHKMMLPTT